MSELQQAMKDRIPVISPSNKPVKVRPAGFDPKADTRPFYFDKRHKVWTRINLDKYEPSQKGVY